MKRFERIDKKRRERFNFAGFLWGFYYSLRNIFSSLSPSESAIFSLWETASLSEATSGKTQPKRLINTNQKKEY